MTNKAVLTVRSGLHRGKDILLVALFLTTPLLAWKLLDWMLPATPVSDDLAETTASLLESTRSAYLYESGAIIVSLLFLVPVLYFTGELKKPIAAVLTAIAILLSIGLLCLALQMPSAV